MSTTDLKPRVIKMVQCDVRLDGKTVIITGANSGIGYETALDLAGRGAKVIMACRDIPKAEEAKQKILKELGNANVYVKKIDLASLASVRSFAEEINELEDRLDILINNAGMMMCPYWKTEDGFEMQLGVNHVGHFLLTNLLLDLIKKSAPSRIVIVSSLAYLQGSLKWDDMMSEESYNSLYAYSASKLANVLHCRELSERLEGTGVSCYALHPGIIRTDLARHIHNPDHMGFMWRMVAKTMLLICHYFLYITVKQGAQTSIYCAIAPELANESGKFYSNCAEANLSGHAMIREDAKKLWKLSEEWTKEEAKES